MNSGMGFSFRRCASSDRTIPKINRNVSRLNQAKGRCSERYALIEQSAKLWY